MVEAYPSNTDAGELDEAMPALSDIVRAESQKRTARELRWSILNKIEAWNVLSSLMLQTDGKILVGGYCNTLGGRSLTNIARLNADGTFDLWFNPGAGAGVFAVAVQDDGKILATGWFSTPDPQIYNLIRRLRNTDPAAQSLTHDGSTVRWLRGGTSPEVWRTTFDHSTDGVAWTSLGAGSRIPGGWQLAGLSLPPRGIIRARGYVSGGNINSPGYLVETIIGAPAIVTPLSYSLDDTGTVTFSISAVGTEPLSYQWCNNGVALVNGDRIAGAQTRTLTIGNFLESHDGVYTVVIGNAEGSVTNAVTLVTPSITWEPEQGPIIIKDPFTVTNWTTLIIKPGTIVKFANSSIPGTPDPALLTCLTVKGVLDVQGTPDNPVIFTSIRDDSVGGDSNGDGTQSSPAAGINRRDRTRKADGGDSIRCDGHSDNDALVECHALNGFWWIGQRDGDTQQQETNL